MHLGRSSFVGVTRSGHAAVLWPLNDHLTLDEETGSSVSFQGLVFVDGQWVPVLWDALGNAHSATSDDFDIVEPEEPADHVGIEAPRAELTEEFSDDADGDGWKDCT